MENEKNNGRGIFYGVIGVATLLVAIIGATFAYFTATASSNANDITGNMATTSSFTLEVEKATKIDETAGGMIPMSNGMVEAAVNLSDDGTQSLTNGGPRAICQDQNGNAVCQIYKITVDNSAGTIGGLFDGYVTLTGGSGEPADLGGKEYTNSDAKTTMRWAQVFCSDKSDPQEGDSVENCSTGGKSGFTLDASGSETEFTAIGNKENGMNSDNIYNDKSQVTESGKINGQSVEIIKQNYIRISDHNKESEFTREKDITSALVFDQNIAAQNKKVFYIVVWLSENNKDQSVNVDGANSAATSAQNFFQGTVTFNSAGGGKISSVFTGYTSATEGE